MTLLSAQTIMLRCSGPKPMITPFSRRMQFAGLSYGLSGAGYDIRLAEDLTLEPGDYVLASAMEYFDLPNDVAMVVRDKSTWARRGVTLQNTVAEPGWIGFLTLEIGYHGRKQPWWWRWRNIFHPMPERWPWPTLKLEAGTPIAQVMFEMLDEPTTQPYRGKYQHQASGPTPALHHNGLPISTVRSQTDQDCKESGLTVQSRTC